MNTKHTQGQWAVNEKYQVEARNKMGKLMARFSQFTPSGFNGKEEANAKLISAAPELLEALEQANEELKSIIMVLDGRISLELAKTDLGMRLVSFFNRNAFICEDKIQPIIDKATK